VRERVRPGYRAAALKPAVFFGNDDVLYLMEDMATAEIRLGVLWEWLQKGATFTADDAAAGVKRGDPFTLERFQRLVGAEFAKLERARNRDVHDDSKATTLPIARAALEAYVTGGGAAPGRSLAKPPWYVDLLQLTLDRPDLAVARKRIEEALEETRGVFDRIKNNIRAIFQRRRLSIVSGRYAWTLRRLDQIEQHRKPLCDCGKDELWRGELDLELSELDRLRTQHEEVEKKLRELSTKDNRVQLLETIPGVGRRTAEVVVACLDDARRFKNARQVSSYAGLVPRRYQSGLMDRQGRIHKRGPRLLRTALVEAAWIMQRYNPWAKAVYQRICANQKNRKKKAIIAVARKLLVRCWAMLLHETPWNGATTTTLSEAAPA
jgi:hypothetical protein